MNAENERKLFELYTLAELSYKKKFKNVINEDMLYPRGWYSDDNYEEKINIIAEAIKTNTLIVNTSLFQKMIEKSSKTK